MSLPESSAPSAERASGPARTEPDPASGSTGPPAIETGAAGPVADALAELAAVPGLPLAEHPDAYQRIHVGLQGALAELDEA